MNDKEQMPRSPSSRVSVNGGKIKYLRESKGLTQLYVAGCLGVTTDTVSRWENGRYPTVKWENVEKLGDALEVEPEELLDTESESIEGEPSQKKSDSGAPIKSAKSDAPPKLFIPIISILLILLLVVVFYFSRTGQRGAVITATRFLPRHIAPGQPFPVVVRVESSSDKPFTFIMEEKLPENFTVVRGEPEVASADPENNTVKWINNSRQSPFFLAYLVQTPVDLKSAGGVAFTGRIKADNAPRFEQNIRGDSGLTMSNYHWVDTNSDGVIDDEEILTAFSSADVLKKLGVDMNLIRRIWSAGGYSWDKGTNQYRIGE